MLIVSASFQNMIHDSTMNFKHAAVDLKATPDSVHDRVFTSSSESLEERRPGRQQHQICLFNADGENWKSHEGGHYSANINDLVKCDNLG